MVALGLWFTGLNVLPSTSAWTMPRHVRRGNLEPKWVSTWHMCGACVQWKPQWAVLGSANHPHPQLHPACGLAHHLARSRGFLCGCHVHAGRVELLPRRRCGRKSENVDLGVHGKCLPERALVDFSRGAGRRRAPRSLCVGCFLWLWCSQATWQSRQPSGYTLFHWIFKKGSSIATLIYMLVSTTLGPVYIFFKMLVLTDLFPGDLEDCFLIPEASRSDCARGCISQVPREPSHHVRGLSLQMPELGPSALLPGTVRRCPLRLSCLSPLSRCHVCFLGLFPWRQGPRPPPPPPAGRCPASTL